MSFEELVDRANEVEQSAQNLADVLGQSVQFCSFHGIDTTCACDKHVAGWEFDLRS